jgi:CYTH domain-containing protein
MDKPALTPLEPLPANDVASTVPLEIERKYLLLETPDLEHPTLLAGVRLEYETTYLKREGEWKERVRQVEDPTGTHYYHTRKRRLHGIVQEEDEREVSFVEYETLRARRDPVRVVVKKTRIKFPYQERIWELDLYHEPVAAARLEVELEDERDRPEPPVFLGSLREVSADRRYSDRSLAKHGQPGIDGP